MATQITDRYCPICGKPVTDSVYNRFGEWCCSEADAEAYVVEVRAQKQRQLAVAEPTPAAPRRERHRGCC